MACRTALTTEGFGRPRDVRREKHPPRAYKLTSPAPSSSPSILLQQFTFVQHPPSLGESEVHSLYLLKSTQYPVNMRLVASLTALVALSVPVFPAAVNVKRASSYLEITLSQVSNTLIKAVVQNTGSDELSFVHLNFFKDPVPVKKVSVYRDGKEQFRSPSGHQCVLDADIVCLQGLKCSSRAF